MGQKWDLLINPSSEEVSNACRAFAESHKIQIQPRLMESLRRGSFDSDIAKNFLVSHETYLYGVVSVPSSSSDGLADFVQVTLLACESHLLTFATGVANPNSIGGTYIKDLQEMSKRFNGSGGSIGKLISDLIALSSDVLNNFVREVRKVVSSLDSQSNSFIAGKVLTFCETELLSVKPVMAGLAQIAEDIANDIVDLRSESGVELFNRELEIDLKMLSLRVGHIDLYLQEALKLVDAGHHRISNQYSQENSRNMHLVLALMVLSISPILMLNVYSQFFAEGERWSSSFSSQFFWIPISVVLAVELIYFRKIKWLASSKNSKNLQIPISKLS